MSVLAELALAEDIAGLFTAGTVVSDMQDCCVASVVLAGEPSVVKELINPYDLINSPHVPQYQHTSAVESQ